MGLLNMIFCVASCGGGGDVNHVSPPEVPAAPRSVTVVSDPGQASIAWEGVKGAIAYNVYYSTTTGVTKSTGTKVAGVTSPHVVPGLTNGTNYFFVVTAVNSLFESLESSEVSTIPPIEYIAIGDSITYGMGDDLIVDGTGFEPMLSDLLTVSKGVPHRVVNLGVPGINSAGGAAVISSIVANFPSANYYLVMYGTNDANNPPVPSGMGALPGEPGYGGSYKENMQRIVSAIVAAGKTPFLAYVPFNKLPDSFSDPSIREYNVVIDEVRSANGISTAPPDFYGWFQSHPSELGDWLHPNGIGYQSMATLWFNALH